MISITTNLVFFFTSILLTSLCPARVHQRVILDEMDVGSKSHGFRTSPGVLLNEKSECLFWTDSSPASLIKVGARGVGEIVFSANLELPGNRVLPYGLDYQKFNRNGDVGFLAETQQKNGDSTTNRNGIYLFKSKKLHKVALEGDSAPGGGVFSGFLGDSSSFPPFQFSDNGIMVFAATTLGGGGEGIYRAQVVSDKIVVSKVAVIGDASPDGGRFKNFEDTRYLRINRHGAVLFGAETTINSSRLFHHLKEDLSLALPSAAEQPFLNEYWLNNSGTILIADSISKYISVGPPNSERTMLIEAPEFIPNGSYYRYYDYPTIKSIVSDSYFVFTAQENEGELFSWSDQKAPGIYLWNSGKVKKIALESDTPPEGGFYSDLKVLGAGGGWVYFHADLSGGEAILRGNGTTVERVISTGDFLEGHLVNSLYFAESHGCSVNGKGQILYPVGLKSAGGASSDGLYLWPVDRKPVIQVQQPKGNYLDSGRANLSFGITKVGAKGRSLTFQISNTGTAPISSLKVRLVGEHPKDFTLTPLKKNSIDPRSSALFQVTFRPTGKNKRTAVIQIFSNDKSSSPFNIQINGRGITP